MIFLLGLFANNVIPVKKLFLPILLYSLKGISPLESSNKMFPTFDVLACQYFECRSIWEESHTELIYSCHHSQSDSWIGLSQLSCLYHILYKCLHMWVCWLTRGLITSCYRTTADPLRKWGQWQCGFGSATRARRESSIWPFQGCIPRFWCLFRVIRWIRCQW